MQHGARIGRHGCQPVHRGLRILKISVAAPAQQRFDKDTGGQRAPDTATRGEEVVDDTSGQIDGTVDVSEPGLPPCDVDVGDRQNRQRESLVQRCFAGVGEQIEAGLSLWAVSMDERDTLSGSSGIERKIVTGSLRKRQCFGGVAQCARIRQ